MSRSYRKPYFTEGMNGSGTRKRIKRYFNKKIRRSESYKGGYYKKQNQSWDICDWKFYCSKNSKLGRK